MAKPSPWKVTESQVLHDGQPWLTLHAETVQLPDGREVAPYFRIDMRDFAIVHATTKAGEVLVLNLYRHGPCRIELALPGGLIDDGETPLVAAQRELMEETGYHATNWHTLGSYIMNSNYGCSRCHVFMASEAEQITRLRRPRRCQVVTDVTRRPSGRRGPRPGRRDGSCSGYRHGDGSKGRFPSQGLFVARL